LHLLVSVADHLDRGGRLAFPRDDQALARSCLTLRESSRLKIACHKTDRLHQTTGKKALWSSDFGQDGQGTITVSYGGKTASFSVRARKPTLLGNPRMPPDYFAEFLLPAGWDHTPALMKGDV